MDKFLSGFGLSGFMSSQSPKGSNSPAANTASVDSLVPAASANSAAPSANATPAMPASRKVWTHGALVASPRNESCL